jgi:hypothetical protein
MLASYRSLLEYISRIVKSCMAQRTPLRPSDHDAISSPLNPSTDGSRCLTHNHTLCPHDSDKNQLNDLFQYKCPTNAYEVGEGVAILAVALLRGAFWARHRCMHG